MKPPKKQVLFVRHGESEGNANETHGRPDETLTELGRDQAKALAERLARLPVDAVLSSTDLRARQTAEIICKASGRTFEPLEIFRESRSPSVVRGKRFDDPEAQAVYEVLRENRLTPGWRHSDEDTLEERRDRAGAALDLLAARPEAKLLVVSHSHFIKAMAASVLLQEALTPALVHEFAQRIYLDNTGISEFRLTDKGIWRIFHWNDIAHFG